MWDNDSLKNFEARFDATVCGYDSAAPTAKLPDALVSFIMIGNAALKDSQRVSVLSAASLKPSDSAAASAELDNGAILDQLKYDDVLPILRSFNEPKNEAVGTAPRSEDQCAVLPLSTAVICFKQNY